MVLVQKACQSVELILPEAAIAGDPRVRRAHRAGDEPAAPHAAVAPAHDEPRALEYAHVLGHGREGHVERLGEGAHGGFPGQGEVGEHGAPGRIGEGRERRVESGAILNHVVYYYAT